MSAAANALVSEALKLINADAAKAEALLRAALQADPSNNDAQLVLSEALRKKGDLVEALKFARMQAQARPQWFGAQRQMGVILAEQGEALPASIALRRAAELNPGHPTIWRELAEQLALSGDRKAAEDSYAIYAAVAPEPKLKPAQAALQANDAAQAEAMLNAHLKRFRDDVVAIWMLSEAQARAGRVKDAEASLRRALSLAPGYGQARHSLGQLLMGLGRLEEADSEADKLLKLDPRNHGSRRLKAAILSALGENEKAIAAYESLLKDTPRHAGTWMSYGHVLKTVGRTDEGVEAYRRSVTYDPKLGVAWFSLANLKTFKFSDDDLKQMEAQLQRADLSVNDRVNLLYALGKAHEDSKRIEPAFARYDEGAKLYRANIDYDLSWLETLVADSERILTPAFFEERAGGCEAQDPIFIVGLPRAGSTLLEQILASHSMVEGTMELGDVNSIVADLGGGDSVPYIDKLPGLSAEQRKAFGETYLRTTRIQRKLGRPLFINKMPNDFRHIGLIHLILPNAKIIDARRHPMACGWSCYKQHFAMGQHYTYDMAELGAYYRSYVRLMEHYDRVLPGRVHRVIHEELVSDPEPHIRALLEYCGLPFEEACLSPHETQRAVKTASSEQVRQPISAKGLESWKAYEPYLGPLRNALGDVVDFYPKAPRF